MQKRVFARGRYISSTNEFGARVVDPGWCKDRSIYPEALAATIYSVFGIAWTKQVIETLPRIPFGYEARPSGTTLLDVGTITAIFSSMTLPVNDVSTFGTKSQLHKQAK